MANQTINKTMYDAIESRLINKGYSNGDYMNQRAFFVEILEDTPYDMDDIDFDVLYEITGVLVG